MIALEKSQPKSGLWRVDAPIPQIGADDVLVRISKTGICGTDIHIWNWDEWSSKTVPVPMIIGHEFAGEIVEVGANVKKLKIGQRCSGEGHLVGENSRQSRAGLFHLDPETNGIGVNKAGAFAEYLCLPAFNVVLLPDEIPDEIGAILDPLGNAVHATLSFELLGEDVLITGAGPIGIMSAAVAKYAGARNVVITDVNQNRLDLVKHIVPNATAINVAKQELSEEIAQLGIVQGFDVGIEMSGNATAFNQMIDNLVIGGKVAMLGIPAQQSLVDWSKIIFKSITIKGIYGRRMFETWYKMIVMLQNGLDISAVITHQFAAHDFAEGFKTAQAGNSGKVVLDWKNLS